MDRVREMLAELREEVLWRHASLTCHALHLVLTEDTLELLRRHRLVWAVANPGLRNMSEPGSLELGDQAANSTRASKHLPG